MSHQRESALLKYDNEIYIGTVLLERNRWTTKEPSFLVSEWTERFKSAGFDGIELWENHALLSTQEEMEKLESSSVPIKIINSYARCSDNENDDREISTKLVYAFNANGLKFNLGREAESMDAYINNTISWRKCFNNDFRMLCECHKGTVAEEPAVISELFKKYGDLGIELIIHPFGHTEDYVENWFKYVGPYTTHCHVQRILDAPKRAVDIVYKMREAGYRGSYTIEFTKGVNAKGENATALFENACRDLEYLKKLIDR